MSGSSNNNFPKIATPKNPFPKTPPPNNSLSGAINSPNSFPKTPTSSNIPLQKVATPVNSFPKTPTSSNIPLQKVATPVNSFIRVATPNNSLPNVPINNNSFIRVATPNNSLPNVSINNSLPNVSINNSLPNVPINNNSLPNVSIINNSLPKIPINNNNTLSKVPNRNTLPLLRTSVVPIITNNTLPQVPINNNNNNKLPQVPINNNNTLPQVLINNNNNKLPQVPINNNNNNTLSKISNEKTVSEIELRPRQIEWANRAYNILLNNYGYIDTSRMGSGKTFVLVWLAKVIGIRLIIVCPVIMINIWKNITETYGIPVLKIISYASLRSKTGYQPKHGYLHRYDNISENGKKMVRFEVSEEYLELVKSGVLVVFDEMQNIKNDSTQYKAAAAMLHPIINMGGRSRFALLSGTPFDDEKHAINLLRLIGYIRSPRLYYYDRYNKTTFLEGLNELILSCNMIDQQQTQQVLEDIPPNIDNINKLAYELYIHVIKPNISGSMPPPDIHGTFDIKNGFFNINPYYQYDLILGLEELFKALNLITRLNAIKNNKLDMDNINPDELPEKIDLGALTKALVKIENAKAFDMSREASSILSSSPNNKVIISINYTSTLTSIATFLSDYNPLILYGKTTQYQRSQIINLFNTDPSYRLLIMNTSVGGVGISLHDTVGNYPRFMLISPSYKLIEIIQAASRIYRDGTMSDAHVRIFYGKGTVGFELSVLIALSRKSGVLKGIIDEYLNDLLLLPGEYPMEEEL